MATVKIYEARKKCNYSLGQLSEKTGICRSTLWAIENGKLSPRIDQIESIANATKVKICDLFDSAHK